MAPSVKSHTRRDSNFFTTLNLLLEHTICKTFFSFILKDTHKDPLFTKISFGPSTCTSNRNSIIIIQKSKIRLTGNIGLSIQVFHNTRLLTSQLPIWPQLKILLTIFSLGNMRLIRKIKHGIIVLIAISKSSSWNNWLNNWAIKTKQILLLNSFQKLIKPWTLQTLLTQRSNRDGSLLVLSKNILMSQSQLMLSSVTWEEWSTSLLFTELRSSLKRLLPKSGLMRTKTSIIHTPLQRSNKCLTVLTWRRRLKSMRSENLKEWLQETMWCSLFEWYMYQINHI